MRIDPFQRQVAVFLGDLKSPQARSARLAKVAKEGIAEIRETNRAAGGSDQPPRVTVDGREGAPLESVRPDGVIVAEFDMLRGVLEWIGEELVKASPVLTGQYARSHVLFADGVEVNVPGPIPPAREYVFVNTTDYARKIERGLSPQAPQGVYDAVAAAADRRFGNVADISVGYTAVQGGSIVASPGVRDIAAGLTAGGMSGDAASRTASKTRKARDETRRMAIYVRGYGG